jgi:hypothetical protein
MTFDEILASILELLQRPKKMRRPEQCVKDWESKHPRVQRGLLRHWQKDVVRNQELAEVMRGLLRERGVQL